MAAGFASNFDLSSRAVGSTRVIPDRWDVDKGFDLELVVWFCFLDLVVDVAGEISSLDDLKLFDGWWFRFV